MLTSVHADITGNVAPLGYGVAVVGLLAVAALLYTGIRAFRARRNDDNARN
jgi:hypothetical protein